MVRRTRDGQTGKPDRSPTNRLGIDYRDVPRRKVACHIVDAHCHVHSVAEAEVFLPAAETYGITDVLTMTPMPEVSALREEYGNRLNFIAIPNWRAWEVTPTFRSQWVRDLERFRELGAVLCKFWMAPPMRGQHGLTLEHEFLQPVIDAALDLGFGFMTHISDPAAWFEPGGRYGDARKFGTWRDQFTQMDYFLDKVAPQPVIGAHMGGCVEDLALLQGLLDRHANYHLDCSATKWIVRGVASQPDVAREFVIRNQDRILFGSDLVTARQHDFDHYASRYWAHLQMWETPFRGESPIEDPDAESPPKLAGLDLPADVLEMLYHANAERLALVRPPFDGDGSVGPLRPT
ncbi:MAG: amidohydrolase family protein [Phycisphaerae bacterium]|nr:amidohydrolase family protein [Phycisphaerae bacterium]